jgi:hypothetical protein
MDPQEMLNGFGSEIESRLISELSLSPMEQFRDLLDLKNLDGKVTGYIKVFNGDRIEKASSLSINMMPGMRYFNIHVIPDAQFKIPRYLFEGMLFDKGSQISMDMFADVDYGMNIEYLKKDFTGVKEIYDAARKNQDLLFESSRQAHMRAFASPFFLCAFGVAPESLPTLSQYADRYFDEWKKLFSAAQRLTPSEAEEKQSRRTYMAKTIIAEDPDRERVVHVYGEELTASIEAASML